MMLSMSIFSLFFPFWGRKGWWDSPLPNPPPLPPRSHPPIYTVEFPIPSKWMSRSMYRMRFGSSSCYLNRFCISSIPISVNNEGVSLNWIRTRIMRPLVIHTRIIWQVSMCIVQLGICWKHIVVLDMEELHDNCCHTRRQRRVWMMV